MQRGRKSKENLNSSAFKTVIPTFTPQQVAFECLPDSTIATFSPYEYFDTWHVGFDSEKRFDTSRREGLIRNFPMIIQGDGMPWDLGNLYLMYKYNQAAASSTRPSIDTLDNIASHLLAYRRWLEDAQTKGQDIHELFFPEEAHRRVTYRYSRYLDRQTGKTISASTAGTRISVITNFYRGLSTGGLVGEYDNAPFKERRISIRTFNNLGLERLLTVITTDLRVSGARNNTDDSGYIIDEGRLRPISEEDQKLIFEYLPRFDRYRFTLMVLFALFTGARIATVGTLRIAELRALTNDAKQDPDGSVWLKIGFGTRIDMKLADRYKKRMRLCIPSQLLLQILEYIDSPSAALLRQQEASFYEDTDNNYVFLTDAGTPYVTSKTEIEDRQNDKYSQRINKRDRVDFVIAKGNGIRNLVNQFNDLILSENPNYKPWKFHYLRATFGLNYVRDALEAGLTRNETLDSLRALMGHASVATTLTYLDFSPNTEKIKAITEAHADRLDAVLRGQGE